MALWTCFCRKPLRWSTSLSRVGLGSVDDMWFWKVTSSSLCSGQLSLLRHTVVYKAQSAMGLVNTASTCPPPSLLLGPGSPLAWEDAMDTPGETKLAGRGGRRRQGRSKEQDMCVVGDLGGLQGLHIPQGTSSKKFHAPVRTHKIKDVLPYATIYPEQVMKTSLPLITGGEAERFPGMWSVQQSGGLCVV